MTRRPILFSTPMVRALLAGRKTQTRRLLSPRPALASPDRFQLVGKDKATGRAVWEAWSGHHPCNAFPAGRACVSPIAHTAAKGDRLYVREAWKPHSLYAGMKPRDIPVSRVFYQADDGYAPSNTPWRPGIHMPRWASRLTLIVEDVRVQRLQDVSKADAIAEGIERLECRCGDGVTRGLWHGVPHVGNEQPVQAFADLWDSLHNPRGYACADDAPESWQANPWIVALTFRVEHRNIDAQDGGAS